MSIGTAVVEHCRESAIRCTLHDPNKRDPSTLHRILRLIGQETDTRPPDLTDGEGLILSICHLCSQLAHWPADSRTFHGLPTGYILSSSP